MNELKTTVADKTKSVNAYAVNVGMGISLSTLCDQIFVPGMLT